ncbi:hypothetical protein VOLCADRAFT_96344 [Volvox carteri f. nagariensis]|uniref:EXS domain-containing protein n=1 Tax=Volvox carteri f. nagariensis TaxID=3068 RepID=D8U9V5_VOLCA|nr:uncharacterized protein VOLCADRAFT_96344 [Volvox carteri f. nagariensis]EFJ43538.1 hypothetical protein VOLCADRAFT_96344 [Volvox carteri f. nagariensis]|eukprot:XP_002955467.1 hypothetical protein VOLCADRAFT_96344 [Volvox carteri f. nagariensis]
MLLYTYEVLCCITKPHVAAQVALAAWCCGCLLAVSYYVPIVNRIARELLLLYFQPLIPVVTALWLWGHNVQRFHALGIEYELCFSAKDRKLLLSHGEIYQIAFFLTIMCITCAAGFAALAAAGAIGSAELTAVVMYFFAVLLLVAPLDILAMPARLFFGQTLQRVLLPFQDVSWADFLLADIMTSLSKSSGDLAKTVAVMVTGPALHVLTAVDATGKQLVNPLAPPVLLAICLPYIIRFIQCIIVNRATGNRSQLLNAAKYATAFPALLLTAFEQVHHVKGESYSLYKLWIFAMLLNSLYSFYWDIEMDWDMPWLVQSGSTHVLGVLRLPSLKPDAMYSRGWYVWAIISNLVLRLAWTHRLMGNLEKYTTVALVIALLEVFRRYQWTYIRIETELRKIRLSSAHAHSAD